MKVNMTPNPLDVVTIHASQGDTEARQWEFELHNNGELIDTSEITEQLFFKAYKGGTEQLLPENTSTPTTTPILADIQYPDGLRTDQYFTYRETPTTVSNKARIKTIKGQTLKWNQACCKERYFNRIIDEWQNTFTNSGVTFTYLDDYTVRITGTPTARTYIYANRLDDSANYPVKQGEKLLLRCSDVPNGIDIFSSFYYGNTWKGAGPRKSNRYVAVPSDVNKLICVGLDVQSSLVGQTIDVTVKVNLFNLTQMFGSGNEPTEEEFNALFPFYYPYNSGSLIPFNGNGIKTVGKNLLSFPYASESTSTITVNNDGSLSINKTASGDVYFNLYTADNGLKLPSGDYIIKSHNDLPSNVGIYCVVRLNGTTITNISLDRNNLQRTINIPNGAIFICYMQLASAFIGQTEIKLTMSAEDLEAFEPYTSSTTNLPVSTYFPTGMKSAGTVYDELTPMKAITRIGAVDLGILTWSMASNNRFISTGIASTIKAPSSNTNKANVLCAKYETQTYSGIVDSGLLGVAINANSPNTGNICIKDTTYSSASEFKTAMSGVYLYYELATPTETSFTTASLVTENAEIPLSNEDGVLIGKCTEELSAEPGFHDAKIKLTDSDGECYSNKIQLHIERSPK